MDYLRLLRPKQWTKNLFVFSALVFSKHLFDAGYLQLSLKAFVIFSLVASFIYIINDAMDRDRDRLHPKKRKRPIAAGLISLPLAYSIALAILLVAVFLVRNL